MDGNGRVDLSVCQEGDVLHLRDGGTDVFDGPNSDGEPEYPFRTKDHEVYRQNGSWSPYGSGDESPWDILRVTRGETQVTPAVPVLATRAWAIKSQPGFVRIRLSREEVESGLTDSLKGYGCTVVPVVVTEDGQPVPKPTTPSPPEPEARGAETNIFHRMEVTGSPEPPVDCSGIIAEADRLVEQAGKPATPAAVITGPGKYRTELFAATGLALDLVEIGGLCDSSVEKYPAVGLWRGCPGKWTRTGTYHDSRRSDLNITGPYVPTLLEACDALFEQQRKTVADRDGFVRLKVDWFIQLAEAMDRERAKTS